MEITKIKRLLQVIAVNLVICFILSLSLSATVHASTANNQNITFYIDNQIINSDKTTIRLVRGYTDHPSFKNLYTGNNKITLPEGTYTLSIFVNDGYIIDQSNTYNITLKKPANRVSILTYDSYDFLATHILIVSYKTKHLFSQVKLRKITAKMKKQMKKDSIHIIPNIRAKNLTMNLREQMLMTVIYIQSPKTASLLLQMANLKSEIKFV